MRAAPLRLSRCRMLALLRHSVHGYQGPLSAEQEKSKVVVGPLRELPSRKARILRLRKSSRSAFSQTRSLIYLLQAEHGRRGLSPDTRSCVCRTRWMQGACASDVKSLCGSVQPGGGRIRDCMREHRAQLSNNCKLA